jgi:hypothetical protein
MNDDDDSDGGDWYGEADPRVPDATPWPDRDLGFLGDDVYLGEENGIPEELRGSHVPSGHDREDAELR